jgi:hypothetical protein
MTGERQRRTGLIGAVLVAMGMLAGCASPPPEHPRATPAAPGTLKADLGRMPVSFVANHGRWDPRASWLAAGAEATAYFVDGGVRWALDGWALDQMLVGARVARPTASVAAPGTVSYFGDQPATALPTATELTLAQAWPGVDVVWSGTGGQIEATYHLAAGADPAQVRIAWHGADSLTVTAAGRLQVTTPVRTFEEDAPKAFQEVAGRRVPVEVAYALHGPTTYGFRLGAYDPTLPLVIDPTVLIYAGFLGGSGDDTAFGLDVDGSGNAYVTGYTNSAATFPETTGAFQAASAGNFDAYVAKVAPDGSTLVYASFLSGSSDDHGYGIAVDQTGNAYVSGSTTSTDFPTVNPLQATNRGSFDAFVAKVNPTGTALVYSTYLGGTGNEFGRGIAVDAAGSAYATGDTASSNFPTANPVQASLAGNTDAFVVKVNPAGSALVYSTYLGGTDLEAAKGIAVDPVGSAYVTGGTFSNDFPTVNAIQATNAGGGDAFVAKLNPTGTALVYATYLGGAARNEGGGIAADANGNAYVTGYTVGGFPTVNPIQATNAGGSDAFVAKLNPTGSALLYSTLLGGPLADGGNDIEVDAGGNAYVAGYASAGFPIANTQTPNAGNVDAVVAKLNPTGSALLYSGFLGGSGNDIGWGIGVDGAGNAYVAGSTPSTAATFPETPSVFQPAAGGAGDAFVAKFAEVAAAAPGLATSATPSVAIGGAISDTATVTGVAPFPPPTGTVTFRVYGPNDANCMATPAFTSPPRPLTGGPAPTVNSGPFTPTVAGIYRWVATYSGDPNYLPATGACNDANETSVVTKATPTITTQASAGGMVGTPVRDVATLAGAAGPTGTVTFRLFSDDNCNTEVFASTNLLVGTTATSGWFSPAAPGTYYWTARYSGDANNNPVAAACKAPNESVAITPFQPPAFTRTITGDLIGPVTVNAGESVLITGARVVGPVTVNPGGALTVQSSSITRGIVASAPRFFSLCGTEVTGPAPAIAVSVTNALVPIRVGDPATGCARNRFAGSVILTGNLAVTFGANLVSHDATINNNGPGNAVVKANTVFGTLACSGNNPLPTNADQTNAAGAKTGQCAGL